MVLVGVFGLVLPFLVLVPLEVLVVVPLVVILVVLLVPVRLAGVRLDSIQSPSPGVPGGGGPLDHLLGVDMVVSGSRLFRSVVSIV